MRLREAHIPIVLWVSAALVLHLGGGEQADRMATVHENTSRLRVAARELADPPTVNTVSLSPGNLLLDARTTQFVRATATYTDGVTTDVTTRCSWSSSDAEVASVGTGKWSWFPPVSLALGEIPGQVVGRKPGGATVSCTFEGVTGSTAVVVGELVEVDLKSETPEEPKTEVTPDQKKPEKKEEKKPEPPKKKEEKKEEIVAVMPPLPEEKKPDVAPPPPPPPEEKKISIQQHQDQDEKANPEADYLADKNHHVDKKEQTQAQITSTSENDKNPTPGTHAGAPSEKPGNGDHDKVAQDDDRKGEKVAPNVIPKGVSTVEKPVAQKDPPKHPGDVKGDDKPPAPKAAPAPTVAEAPKPSPAEGKGITAPAPAPTGPTATSENGKETVLGPAASSSAIAQAPNNAPPGQGNGKPKSLPALPSLPTPNQPKWVKGLGYGAKGEGGKPTISIDEKVAKAAVGQDELDRLKKVEGETKLSMHRGAWKSSSLERWRAAIENYVPGVKPGNQTNLGTAAAPWATYLSQIHVRLHPIFADGFVEGLDTLPATNPLNDKSLITRMEIVIKPDGTIHHLGIVKPSGVTAFDIAALDSVDRAAPFGKAPSEIVSPDGLVYLHWEFHRDDMRCSNVNAYPYKLKEGSSPKTPVSPEPTPPSKTGNPEEKKLPGQLGLNKQVPPG